MLLRYIINVSNYIFMFVLFAFKDCQYYRDIGKNWLLSYGGFDQEEETKDIIKVERYEEKYLKKYVELLGSSYDKETLSKSFVMEQTPLGNVIMHYDFQKELFVYYSDNNIPYRYLETVARKYVCTFFCKELYIERHEVVVPIIKDTLPIKTKDLMNQKKNPVKQESTVIEVKMNRYSNAGRFSNFKILQTIPRHITDKKRLMRFSDFKQKVMTK
jgi:hypothetical protein